MLSHATLLAVAAFPVTFTVRLLVTGLYLNLSLYARFVSVVESENQTCLAASAVPSPADTFVAVPAVVALSAVVACFTLLFASAVLSTLPSPT